MKLKFNINYHTAWGESLHVVITYNSKDGVKRHHNLLMQTEDGQTWTVETSAVVSRQHPVTSFTYCYQVEVSEGQVLRREWDMVPRIYYFDATKDYYFADLWRDIPLQYHLFTDAYLTATHRPHSENVEPLQLPLFRRTVLFRVSAPQLKTGQSLALCGSHPAFGDWSPSRYLKMEYAGQCDWMLTVNLDGMMLPLEYKYVIIDDQTHTLVEWEEGENRLLNMQLNDGQVLVVYGETLRVREETWRAAGVVVPVFSLRSTHSYGVGDFGDLRRLVDWAVETGMRVIQTLPVNDTTKDRSWSDSYPYNAISVYALHPHYVDLEAAGTLRSKAKMTAYRRQQGELNASSSSDYQAVDRVKTAYLHELYAERSAAVMATKDYQTFVQDNEHWLRPYAVFCSLRDRYQTARFSEWPQLSMYTKDAVEAYCEQAKDEVGYVFFVQYLLHQQLKQASDYARSHGVVLKGDIPIGICRDSVEAWQQPQLFNLDMQTGAPPDAFSQNGQNWGFPTYNFADETIYKWFNARFRHLEQYFDAFRIDHVLGFFRIWEIPDHAVFGLLGHFSPALPLTVGEIEYFGFSFRKDFCTRPFINDRVLERFFGIHAQYVREHFLHPKAYGLYSLRPEVDTQRKVEAYFADSHDENSLWIRDGLYQLISNVLFLEDPRQPDMYHPRIGVYNAPVFEVLGNDERDAFMRLYNNYFYQRHNLFWGDLAMRKLPQVLKGTRMLVCGEDLGMLPDCVPAVLDALRILTLEIQSMPKQSGVEFSHVGAYPYRSVATFATHDMPPLRLWWEESPERTQRYYVSMLQKEGRAPEHLPAHLAEEIIARHLYSPSMLCLLALQDWLAMDTELRNKNVREERINVPSDPYNHWKWRMHLTIEQLLLANRFNQKVKTIITRSKR